MGFQKLREENAVGLRLSPTFRFPYLFCTGQNKEHENSLRREKRNTKQADMVFRQYKWCPSLLPILLGLVWPNNRQ